MIYFEGSVRTPPVCRFLFQLFQRQRWETSARQGGAHMGFPERIDATLN